MPLPSHLPDDFLKNVASKPPLIADRYSVIKRIGSGNFGTAFLIDDSRTTDENEKQKVLKQICVGPLDPGETVDAMQEAKLLAQMKHRNIVQFHQSFLDGQFFCIVLEYCEGGDLECKIKDCKKKNQTIPENQVIKWMKQLLKAISYMHERRILHRDLKSRNIFLKDNQIKIGDFGISRILIGASDKASTFVGTPYYMSPEVLKHEQYDEKCDVWSLGCVLYEICCLEHAFEGSSLMEVMVKIVSDHTPHLPDTYPRALNNILERMLDREVVKRQTAKQILQHPVFNKMDVTSTGTHHLTARDRLRIKKQKEADARMERLKEIAKIKLRENERIRRQSIEKNFLHSSFDADMQVQEHVNGKDIHHLPTIPDDELQGTVIFKPVDYVGDEPYVVGEIKAPQERTLKASAAPINLDSTDELIQSLIQEGHIPEDSDLADTFYSIQEDFESSSDDDLPDDHIHMSDSEYRDMVGYMEDVLDLEGSATTRQSALSRPLTNKKQTFKSVSSNNSMSKNKTVGGASSKKLSDLKQIPLSSMPQAERPLTSVPQPERPLSLFNNNMVEQRISNMKQRCLENLGEELFEKAYEIVKEIRFDKLSLHQDKLLRLKQLVPDRNKCMDLEQLIYLEQERNSSD